MLSNVIEPTCIYCRNCIQNEAGYTCTAWGCTEYLSPHKARVCEYFELPGAPCHTMKKRGVDIQKDWSAKKKHEFQGSTYRQSVCRR